jgi:hypothetical protein
MIGRAEAAYFSFFLSLYIYSLDFQPTENLIDRKQRERVDYYF